MLLLLAFGIQNRGLLFNYNNSGNKIDEFHGIFWAAQIITAKYHYFLLTIGTRAKNQKWSRGPAEDSN